MLKLWMPCTGDLHNQGLTDYQSSSTAFTVSPNGKIGSCIRTTGPIDTALPMSEWNVNETPVSFGGWFKFSKSEIATAISGLNYNANAHTAVGTLLGFNSFNGLALTLLTNRIYGTDGTKSSLTHLYVVMSVRGGSSLVLTSSFSLPFDEWVHIVGVCDQTYMHLYINGERKYYSNMSAVTPGYGASWMFYISASQVYGGNGPSCSFPTYANDVRVFDHALSPKEINEWSKGLVLHYTLSAPGENLLSRYVSTGNNAPGVTTAGGRTIYYGDYGITIPATENADTYFSLFTTKQLTSGKTYTISCKVDGIAGNSYYHFPLFAQNNSAMGLLKLDHNGVCSLTFTMDSRTQATFTAPSGETVYKVFMDDYTRGISSGQVSITVTNFKIEEGSRATPWLPAPTDPSYTTAGLGDNVEYDVSGYGHDGTKTGTLTYSTDTPRYLGSTYFQDYTRYISCQLGSDWIPEAITMSCWIKGTNKSARGGFHIPLNMHGTNFEISIGSSSGKARMGYVVNGTRRVADVGSDILDGEWHMLTSTYDGTAIRRYIDGVLLDTFATTGPLTTADTVGLGVFPGNTNYGNTELLESDARIYATALSDEDIESLYRTSASVANNGVVYAYEMVEV